MIERIKKSEFITSVVLKMTRILLVIVSFFVPIKENQILFSSFGGRKYDDSPKALYDALIADPDFVDWEFVWAFYNPEFYDLPRGRKIKTFSFEYFVALVSSRVWVDNVGADKGTGFSRKGILEIQTWHGCPLKLIGQDSSITLGGKQSIRKTRVVKKLSDVIYCAQSEWDRAILARMFGVTESSFIISGLPRNDALFDYSVDDVLNIKKTLGINDEKVILYAPTFRDYKRDDHGNLYFDAPIDFDKWEKVLSKDYVVLLRLHSAISNEFATSSNFAKDVSTYPNINDLYAISDYLISDYSSAYVDYSILDRPMFCFAYDKTEYVQKRGLYADIYADLPCENDATEDVLLKHILECDYQEKSLQTRAFHKKYVPNEGNATNTVISEMKKKLFA